jgi:DNA-directed RNA polymerase subunit RPC12/RpoP
MGKVLVLYDSASGNTEKMAGLVAEGAGSIPGIEVFVPGEGGEKRPEVVDFKCPKCGATIAYNVAEGGLACEYCGRRNLLYDVLTSHGFRAERPAGAYYILADYAAVSDLPDASFAEWLTREIGVTPVPGSSFFSVKDPSRRLVRFAFCKREETLRAAEERLSRLPSKARG